MRISIIIPAYNCSKTIENTIQSVFFCGIKDYEILLIEDGSKDNTAELCDQLSRRYENIRSIHKDNKGVSSARNMGIENALGEYVWFVDSDDSIIKGSFTDIENALDKKPDIVVFGACFDYYHHGRLYRSDKIALNHEYCFNGREWINQFNQLFELNMLSPVWNKLIRKELLLEKNIRFNEQMIDMEDYLLSIQAMSVANQIVCLPSIVYQYRQSENEKSTFNRLLRIESISSYVKQLDASVNAALYPNENHTVSNTIYLNYLLELLRYGDIDIIERTCIDMLDGEFAGYVAQTKPDIYQYANHKVYHRIMRLFKLKRIRHWIAVRIKYLLSFRRGNYGI